MAYKSDLWQTDLYASDLWQKNSQGRYPVFGGLVLTSSASIGGTLNVSGAVTSATNTTIEGTVTITVANAAALAVGANGNTNPVLRVGTNTASVATGLLIQGAAAAGGLALSVLSS